MDILKKGSGMLEGKNVAFVFLVIKKVVVHRGFKDK